MTTVFDDTFNGGSVAIISTRAPYTGTGWTQHPSVAGTTISDLGTGFALFDSIGASASVCYRTDALAAANQTVAVTFKRDTGNGGSLAGVDVRGNTSDQACYRALYSEVTGKFHLYRVGTGGSTTELGGTGYTLIWSVGASHTLTLTVTGTGLAVLIDGTSQITATDATITTAGRAGLYNSKTGGTAFDFSINRYTVDTSAAASFNPALLGRSLCGGFLNFGD